MSSCSLISLPERKDARGSLAFAQFGEQLPFLPRRIFHLYGLQAGVARGGHAHKECHQFLISMAGVFEVSTFSSAGRVEWRLDSPAQGLYVPPGQWVDLVPVSASSVLVGLASHEYDEADYIRDLNAFKSYAKTSTL